MTPLALYREASTCCCCRALDSCTQFKALTTLLSYFQVHPPTGVSFCAAAYFTHVEAHGARRTPPNVLLVRATRLEVLFVRCASQVANAVASLELKGRELERLFSLGSFEAG